MIIEPMASNLLDAYISRHIINAHINTMIHIDFAIDTHPVVNTKITGCGKLSITQGTRMQPQTPVNPQVCSQRIRGDKSPITDITTKWSISRVYSHMGLKHQNQKHDQLLKLL